MSEPHLAILGAGPIGLEAALAAVDAGLPFTLYEAAPHPAAHVADWGHVRLFTPWAMSVSPRLRRHLGGAGIPVPDDAARCPTGRQLVEQVLAPAAALPAVAPHLRLGCRVLAVGRQGLLKHQEIASAERARRPFRLLLEDPGGQRVELAARVLDCTGSWGHPNALGDGGIPAPGEEALGERIVRRLPDLAAEELHWAGRTILLAGAGHSAQTAARDLAALARRHPATEVMWALRQEPPALAPMADDPLAERAALTAAAARLAAGEGPLAVRAGVAVESLAAAGARVAVTLRHRSGATDTVTVDRILALTGSVGDSALYRQLQVHECYATCGPMKLAAALLGAAGGGDCLQQTSHGVDALVNPEPGFFLLGAKSYGRNATFLLRVGWQQVDEVFGLLDRQRGGDPTTLAPPAAPAPRRSAGRRWRPATGR
ncbi:MAG TPA: FAD/NAD(P)-binding oxidoreductase [Thermoanaerobaculia bacterium]|nr:FAD/NAD(P)-binding oxidoreductase [Thermoanaerobaculia bacterium]